MRLLKILKYLPLYLMILTNFTDSQWIENYDETSNKDLIYALNFAGIDIISFNLEKVDRNCICPLRLKRQKIFARFA